VSKENIDYKTNVEVFNRTDILINTKYIVYSIEEPVITTATKLYTKEESIAETKELRVFVPSTEAVERRDEDYINRVEETDKLVAESDVTESFITELTNNYSTIAMRGDKLKKIIKVLMAVQMAGELEDGKEI